MRISRRLFTATAGLASASMLLSGCSALDFGGGDATEETTPESSTTMASSERPATTPATTTAETSATEPGPQDETVFNLAEGDCVADIEAVFGGSEETEIVESVGVIDCVEPHTGEVYYIEDLPDGEVPPAEELMATAEQTCIDQFEPFVGASYLQSSLDVAWLHPTPESWRYGDRSILCLIVSAEPATGSVGGSAV